MICIIVLAGCGKNSEETVQASNEVGVETSTKTEELLLKSGEVQEETAEKDLDEKCRNLFAEFKRKIQLYK